MNDLINITINKNGQAVVSSLDVAERFGKQHKNVIQSIQNLAAEFSAAKSMFFEATYENRGKQYPMYHMTRDGFSLLAMGFTGQEALEWKLKYIEAFNKMEHTLVSAARPMSMPEMLLAQAQLMVDHDKRLSAVEENQTKVIAACSVPALGRDEWQDGMKKYLAGLCEEAGLNYSVMYGDLYTELENKMGCDLEARQRNLRRRLKAAGATYREQQSVSKLSVIAGDKTLVCAFEGIVQRYAANLAARRWKLDA